MDQNSEYPQQPQTDGACTPWDLDGDGTPDSFQKNSPLIEKNYSNALNWVQAFDPLVLDLDRDGIETIAMNGAEGAMFDGDADGVRTATGWVGKDDGLLVRDINGNGQIDDGRELFGDSTLLANGQNARHGFEALADLDSNQDGAVDAADNAFGSLRIWKDGNSDGVTQTGELHSLNALGIASLNTRYSTGNTTQWDGNSIAERSTYTRTDGSTAALGDLLFRESNFHSEYTDRIALTEQARRLGNVSGTGRVRDLREAQRFSRRCQQKNLLCLVA